MTPKTDDSVMFAIRELQKLEAERVSDEKRRVEAEKAAREAAALERARHEREAAAHAQKVAEAEARMRIDAERQARDEELALRMASLRKELDAVQADRLRLAERMSASTSEPRRSAGRGWAVAFGLASVVAGGLAVMLVMRSPTAAAVAAEPEPAASTPALIGEAPSALPSATSAPIPSTTLAEAQPAVGPESANEARPRPRVRGERRIRADRATAVETGSTRPSPRETREDRALREIAEDRCGDDPTCGAGD